MTGGHHADIATQQERAAVVDLAHRAADVARRDAAVAQLIGPRLSADLAQLLAEVGPGAKTSLLRAVEAMARSVLAVSTTPPGCPNHRLHQHRNHRPAMCSACGRDRYGVTRLEQG